MVELHSKISSSEPGAPRGAQRVSHRWMYNSSSAPKHFCRKDLSEHLWVASCALDEIICSESVVFSNLHIDYGWSQTNESPFNGFLKNKRFQLHSLKKTVSLKHETDIKYSFSVSDFCFREAVFFVKCTEAGRTSSCSISWAAVSSLGLKLRTKVQKKQKRILKILVLD